MNLAELYSASRTRAAKQHVIEDHICRFNPDFSEAAELVAAVLGGLRGRYEDELGMDVEQAFRDLMDALHEADMTHQTKRYDDEWTDMEKA